MKFLKKLKSGNFWVSLISAGVLIAEGIFDIEIKTEYLNQIILGLMGILTVFGIVSDHGETETVKANNSSTDTTNQTSETDESSASNIRSICDTINLLLNKVSINSNQENSELVHNELISILQNFLNGKNENCEQEKNSDVENLDEQVKENEETQTQGSLDTQEKLEENSTEKIKTKIEGTEVKDLESEIQLIN